MAPDAAAPRLAVPDLAPGEIHAWRFRLEGEDAAAFALLDEGERARAQRFRFARDRRRYAVAHAMVRRILGAYTGQAPRAVAFATEEHGKPRLAGDGPLTFNLSHSEDIALLAVALDLRVGCDIEALRAREGLAELAEDLFTLAERQALEGRAEADLLRAFLTCWTRKEACLKAVGVGLAMEPRHVHVGVERQRLGTRVREFGSPVIVESIIDDGDCVAAIAVAGGFRRVRPFDLIAEEILT